MTETVCEWVDEKYVLDTLYHGNVADATHAIACAVADGRWRYDPNLPGKDVKLYHMHIKSKTKQAESMASPSIP